MELKDSVEVSPHVLARQVGDETVLLHLASGTYFGLDPVGTRIWQLMAEGKTLLEICDKLIADYEVSREDLERDALALANSLAAKELIFVR
jgi:hypothetical protein